MDGYDIQNGMVEFWNMVEQQNIKYIISLNSKFGDKVDEFYHELSSVRDTVYQYFPDIDNMEIEDSYKLILLEKIEISHGLTLRKL